MGKRTWTDEMEQYLADNWGRISIQTLVTKLDKTESAIKGKAKRMKLGGMYSTGDFLTAYQIGKMLNIDGHTVIDYWVKKCGLKGRKRSLNKKEVYMINLEDLVVWLESNTDKWDSSGVELFVLGSEPEWLKLKRKKDAKKVSKNNGMWDKESEEILISYYKAGMGYKEIAERLGRSKDSIERKLYRLRMKHNLSVRKILVPWTEEEDATIFKMDIKGKSDEEIAWELGRELEHVQYRRAKLKELGKYPNINKTILTARERAKEIIKLQNKGFKCIEIAKKLNVHPTTISRNLKALEG